MEPFKSFFKVVGGNEGSLCKYRTRLDVYGRGCAHDCSYCYAKSLLSFRHLWRPDAPAVADLDAVRRKVSHLEPGTVVRLGGMTDCFQPIEAQIKATRATIAMLNRQRVGYLIVTKSHLVATDEYLRLLDPALAHVQVSVTCTDDVKALTYEKCSKTSKRLEAVRRLQDAGIDVALRLSPYIPEFVDLGIVAQVLPQKVQLEFLRVNHWIEKWLDGLVDLSPYTLKHGGYRHLPLERKIDAVARVKDALPGTQLSVCEDVPDHWAYWRDHVNACKDDCCNLRRQR